jgi:hypothetical protein
MACETKSQEFASQHFTLHLLFSSSSSLSLSGTPENQTFDDKRHNDLINIRETEWTIHRNWQLYYFNYLTMLKYIYNVIKLYF